jgi:GNAT superfamily N-acetyltransferase
MAVYSASGLMGKKEQQFNQAGERSNLARESESSTFDAVRASVDEASKGVGTFVNDIKAEQIKAYRGEETSGISGALVDFFGVSEQGKQYLLEDEYKQSKYFREGLPFQVGLTQGEARIKAERYDARLKNGLILSKANTAESVAAFTAGLGAGVFEPKNLVSGVVAGGLIRAPIVGLSNTSTRFLSMKNFLTAKVGAKFGEVAAVATRAGAEGAIAVGITEPSNRASAKLVGDDYTMTDTLMNLVTSVAFGAAIEGGGVAFRNLQQSRQLKLSRKQAQEASLSKLKKKGVEFSESALTALESKDLAKGGIIAKDKAAVVMRRIDDNTHAEAAELASQQIMAGQVVDVSAVGVKKNIDEVLTPEEFTEVVNRKYGTQAQLVQRENDIYVSAFSAPKGETNKGIGSAAMRELVSYADNAKQTMEVAPTTAYGADMPRLVKFYEKFGFVKKGDKMVRKPVIAEKQANLPEKIRAIDESLNNPKHSSTYDAAAIKTVDDYNNQYRDELDDDALQREIDEVGFDIEALRAAGFIDDELDSVLTKFEQGINDADSYVDSIKKAAFCLTRG